MLQCRPPAAVAASRLSANARRCARHEPASGRPHAQQRLNSRVSSLDSEISRRGHWKRGIWFCNSRQICINFAHPSSGVRRESCVNLARNLRQICATILSRTPPSRNFWLMLMAHESWVKRDHVKSWFDSVWDYLILHDFVWSCLTVLALVHLCLIPDSASWKNTHNAGFMVHVVDDLRLWSLLQHMW